MEQFFPAPAPTSGDFSELSDTVAKKAITVTMNSSVSWGENTQIIARRSGDIVVVSGVINIPSGGITTGTIIASVSTNKSDNQYWFSANGPTMGRLTMTIYGNIQAENALSAGYYSFNFSYAVA